MSQQLSLFDSDNNAISHIAGFAFVIRAAMNRAAAASPYSRPQIVDRMNKLAQSAGKRMTQGNAKSISLDTLEKWLNPESENMPSLLAVEVFMQAVGNVEPLSVWLAMHNCAVMTAEDKMLRDFGKVKIKQKRDAEKARMLETQIKEVLR